MQQEITLFNILSLGTSCNIRIQCSWKANPKKLPHGPTPSIHTWEYKEQQLLHIRITFFPPQARKPPTTKENSELTQG